METIKEITLKLPWLNNIPSNWKIERGKRLFKKMQRSYNENDETVTAFRDGQVTLRKNRRVEGFTESIEEHGYQGVQSGDLVIHAMDGFAGAIGVSDSNGKCSPVYSICRPRDNDNPYFYAYFLRFLAHNNYILSLAKGIRERSTDFRFEDFGNILLPSPPISEQDRIIKFLDEKIADIDKYIFTKQKLIDLLNEQKTAIINQAVTMGVNPNVKMKESGVEWWPKIPKGWETVSLTKYFIDVSDYRGATPTKIDEGVQLITAKNIKLGWIDYDISKEYIDKSSYSKVMRRGLPKINDIVFTSEAPLGNCALIDNPDVAFAQRIIRFRINSSKFVPQFVLFSMISNYFQTQFQIRATGSTAKGIKASKLNQLKIFAPPIEEQKDIVTLIENQQFITNNNIKTFQNQIYLSQDYKKSLIAEIVTGKLKV